MKILLFLFQIVTAPTNDQNQVNSIKKLSETVETLVTAINSVDEQAPRAFIMTRDELHALSARSKKPLTEEEFKTRYDRGVQRAHDRFRRLKKDLGKVEKATSWDTLTYKNSGEKVMDIRIHLNTIDRVDGSVRKNQVLLEFIVFGDRLLMDHSMRTISDLHYDLHVMEMIDLERHQELIDKYDAYAFTESETTTIPFQNNKKWGLISLDGTIVVPAQYDSISKFEFNYYHVVTKKGHNLLDKNYKPIYKKPVKNIRRSERSYVVLNDKKSYENVGGEQGEPRSTVEEGGIESIERRKPAADRRITLAERLSTESYQNGPFKKSVATGATSTRNTIQILSNPGDSLITTFRGYDYLDPHNIYLAGRDSLNNSVVVKYTGEVLLKTADAGVFESPGYEHLYDRKTRLFGVYCPTTNVLVEPKYRYIKPVDRDRYFIVLTKAGKLGYLDSKGKELF